MSHCQVPPMFPPESARSASSSTALPPWAPPALAPTEGGLQGLAERPARENVMRTLPTLENHERASYRAAFEGVYRALEGSADALRRAREEAPRLLEELRPLSSQQRLLRVQNSRRFRSLSFADLLLAECAELWGREPEEAESWAALALEICRHRDSTATAAVVRRDLQARAFAFLGNCRRLRRDLQGAAEAFVFADKYLAFGSADPREHAELLELRALLLADLGRQQAAEGAFREALKIALRSGEMEIACRCRLSLAEICLATGRSAESLRLLSCAARDLEADVQVDLACRLQALLTLSEASQGPVPDLDQTLSGTPARVLSFDAAGHGQAARGETAALGTNPVIEPA